MSSQYERAVIERERLNKNPNFLTLGIIGFITVGLIILSVSLFGHSSKTNKVRTEFQKTLFEQTNELFDVNYLLMHRANKNKLYFFKLNKYTNQIQHRFDIISEFIDINNVDVNAKKFAASERKYQTKINLILGKKDNLIQYHAALLKMKQLLPKMLAQNTEINNLLFKSNASKNHIYYVTRQLFLIERLVASVNELIAYKTNPELLVTASDRMGRDMVLINRIYQGLLKGDYKMNVTKINNLKVRDGLSKIDKIAKKISQEVSVVLEKAPDVFQFINVRTDLQLESLKLQKNYQALFFKDY
ncbi:MAG: hypothetical protein ACC653_11465 [Gammaproteobacteria bacterium]